MIKLMKFPKARRHCIEIDEWLSGVPNAGASRRSSDELFSLAQTWFNVMRNCGDDVMELMHDGCPVACIGDAAFAYVNVFKAHVNVGFFRGATLQDPVGLLQGTGKQMRHVKVRPGELPDVDALGALIERAYFEMKALLSMNHDNKPNPHHH